MTAYICKNRKNESARTCERKLKFDTTRYKIKKSRVSR